MFWTIVVIVSFYLDFLRNMEESESTQNEREELKASVNAVEFIYSICTSLNMIMI